MSTARATLPRALLVAALAAAAMSCAAAPALAASPTLTVNSAADWTPSSADVASCSSGTNTCTLRAAVAAANQIADGVQIVFGPTLNGGTIRLTQGSLQVTQGMTIQGPGASQLAVDGSAGVANGIIQDQAGFLSVSGLTLQNGGASDGVLDQQGGGAIQQTAGSLVVSGVTFNANTSGSGNDGGAIYAAGDSTTVTGSTFTSNSASGGIEDTEGGAIYLDSGTLSVSGSTFSGNVGADGGGAIEGDGGPVAVLGSTFTGNSAPDTAANGGAIDLQDGSLSVQSSVFTANSAGDQGTAVNVDNESTLTMSGSHVTSNAGTSIGAAIAVANTLDLSSTLVENNNGGNFGGIYAGVGYLTNVVITGNADSETGTACGDSIGCAGGLQLLSGTLVGTTIQGNSGWGPYPNCRFLGPVTDGGGNQAAPDCALS